MSTFVVKARMDAKRPVLRIVPDLAGSGTNLLDYWDDTNKRWLSGVVQLAITNISLSTDDGFGGTAATNFVTGESLTVHISPPNFNPLNDIDYNFTNSSTLVVGTLVSGSPLYKNNVAINYGKPGPSATLNPDGTISFTAIDLLLQSNAVTDVASTFGVVVTGTITFTPYSPYADIGGTAYSSKLVSGPAASVYTAAGYTGAWSMIAPQAATGYEALVLQVQSVTSGYAPGLTPDLGAGNLTISSPNSAKGSQGIANVSLPLSAEAVKSLALQKNFTFVFAVNNGLIDANAVPVGVPDIGLSGGPYAAFNLANVGLQQPRGAQGTVSAVVGYKIAAHAGL